MTVNFIKVVAGIFNSFFKSKYVTDDSRDMPLHIISKFSDDSLSFITFNKCDVLAVLKTIDITKACGGD